jgi:hypothetical protein
MRGTDVLLLDSALLRGALEALFRAGAAHDLLPLAEAEAGLLHAECLPELLEAIVELLDLVLHRVVEPLRKEVPQILALFREPLDLDVYLIRCHDG